jgi:hypothetical protein
MFWRGINLLAEPTRLIHNASGVAGDSRDLEQPDEQTQVVSANRSLPGRVHVVNCVIRHVAPPVWQARVVIPKEAASLK